MEFVNRMRSFVRDDSGQDLLEYALLVGLIALVTVLAVTNAGKAGQQDLHGDCGVARHRLGVTARACARCDVQRAPRIVTVDRQFFARRTARRSIT